MRWSKYQGDVFEAVRETNDSLLIEAVAGSGKTTTIVEAINHVPRGKSVLLLAFNKNIQVELQRRVGAAARCLTLHSCGFSAWKRFVGADVQVDSRKCFELQKELLTWPERQVNGKLGKLIGLAKGFGIVPGSLGGLGEIAGEQPANGSVSLAELPDALPSITYKGLVADDLELWRGLMEEYGIDSDEADIQLARRLLRASNGKGREVVDFDDMLYLPVVGGAPFEKFDVVFVDEAQDLSGIQRVMLKRMMREGSRLIAVGDSKQAIYHFRGASSDSMPLIREEFKCRELPLSISYRCPQAVVKHAQQWVEQIEWHEEAPEGVVKYCDVYDMREVLQTDALLCRLTRPLVEVAFRFLRARIPCRILGRDIGQGLITLVKKSKIAPESVIGDFEEWLGGYHQRELKRLTERQESAAIGILNDRVATLEVFIADAQTVGDLIRDIEGMFRDDGVGVTLSTIHKAKGLEWPRVFVLDSRELMPCPWANNPQEELNLCYVAATRAQRELYYIDSKGVR